MLHFYRSSDSLNGITLAIYIGSSVGNVSPDEALTIFEI
jgi:uncharacterized SAM-dependent methyltransferase